MFLINWLVLSVCRLCHGEIWILQLDVDILITGHTHQFKAYKHEGGVIINPGSATGAYSSITYDVNPSFVLMDIDGLRVVVYVYELVDGEVKVDKIDFKKPQGPN